jgi:hypothetical protein
MFDFLLRSGLWTAATEMRPSGLKKDNGIPYRLLNGGRAEVDDSLTTGRRQAHCGCPTMSAYARRVDRNLF